jgi:hypothetical protein
METSNNAYTCQSQLMGAEARRLLMPGFSGKALAVLSNTIYLIGERDEVLWVVREGSPVHRRCILTSLPLCSICPGQPFFVSGNSLHIGKGVLVELNRAIEWTPSTVGPRTAAPFPNVAAGLQRLSGILQVLESVDGLGESILLISAVGDGRAVGDHLLRRNGPVARHHGLDPVHGHLLEAVGVNRGDRARCVVSAHRDADVFQLHLHQPQHFVEGGVEVAACICAFQFHVIIRGKVFASETP